MADSDDAIADVISGGHTAAMQNLISAYDSSPDDAARSVQIGQATGQDPNVVDINRDDQERQLRTALSSQIIQNNPHLEAYLSQPIAAKLSHDDLANLDYFSQSLSGVGQVETMKAMASAFKDAFAGSGKEFQDFSDWADKQPVLGNIFIRGATKAAVASLDIGMRTISGGAQALASGLGTALQAGLGVNPASSQARADALEKLGIPDWIVGGLAGQTGERFTRDVLQGLQVAAPEAVPEAAAVHAAVARFNRTAGPYLAEGRIPPVGLDPVFDEFHREQVKEDVAQIQDALKNALKTQTRERSPDALAEYVRLHGVDGDIGVTADAVRALYGDKVPAADDGLLGWVPRIQEQLQAAEATGGDIKIPLADWLAKVEPEVEKQLAEHVRVRPEGMTLDEAKQPINYPARPEASATDPAIDAVSNSARLNPPAVTEALAPKQLELPVEGTTNLEDRDVFKGAAAGLTKKQTTKYQALAEKQIQEKRDFIEAKLRQQEERRQSKAYAERKIELRSEVVDDINSRPETALDEGLREGKIKINPESLTDVQKAMVPKEWLDPNGYAPHDLADSYGSDIGLFDRILAVNQARDAAGMKPHLFKRRQIDMELESRLASETKAANFDEIQDFVLSQTQEQMLHEQTMALAEAAKQYYPIDPDAIKQQLREYVQQLNVKDVTKDKFMADAGKAGRAMEDAFQAKNWIEAFRQSQRQQLAFLAARYAKDVEKAVSGFEHLATKYSKREVKGTLPEYTNAIHSILDKVGLKIGRTREDLAREVAKSEYTSLPDFIAKKERSLAVTGDDLPVADFLLADKVPNAKDMTAWEFMGLHQSVKVLDYMGRMEDKVIREGEAYDRRNWVADALKSLAERLEPLDKPFKEQPLVTKFRKQAIAAFHSLETVFRRFDGRDPRGMFTEMFVYPASKALNDSEKMGRDVSREYRALGELKDPNKPVPHEFKDWEQDGSGELFKPFDRQTLDAIIANIGNKYNLDRMAYTLGLFAKDEKGKIVPDTESLLRWVEANSAEADISRAQKRGDIFAGLKERSDNVYRGIYGIAPEDIKTQPFMMHGRQWEGWYHPIIQDAERSLRDHAEVDTVTKPTSFWPSTPNSYTKRRTGAYERLSLNLAEVPLKLNQVVHDIAVRDFVNNSTKIVNDSEFRLGIGKYYGKEYHDIMKKWLYDIAGNASYNQSAIDSGVRVSNFLRQNVISTYVAFNLGTVFKHAPTAAIMSMHQMGSVVGAAKFAMNSAGIVPAHFAHWVMNFFGRDPALAQDAWEFAHANSEELQRRDRNWMDTMSGAHDILYGKDSWRNRIMQWGAKAVALSDMASAVPLWYTKYHESLAEHGIHGDAVDEANQAVRNAHGSTSIASRPVIASEGGALAPWFTSLYGFFGANMQRKIELMHDINDAYKLGFKEGDIDGMAKKIPGITAATVAQVLFPALIEEMVTGQFTDDKRGLLQKSAGFLLIALSNSIVGLRDFSWGLEHGQEPGAGLISSAIHDFMAPVRDLEKPRPMSRTNAGKLVQDGLTAFGDATGMMPKPVARATRFGIDVANRQQHPRTIGDWYRGIVSGQTQLHQVK